MELELQADKPAIMGAYSAGTPEEKALLEKLFGTAPFESNWREDLNSACEALGIDKSTALPYNDPKGPEQAVLNAYAALRILAKWKRNGWKPDWEDSRQAKFYPWFKMQSGFAFFDCGSAGTLSRVGSRLCFPTREASDDFGKRYEQLYKIVFTN